MEEEAGRKSRNTHTYYTNTYIHMQRERKKLNLKADLSESTAGALGLQE